MAGADVRVRVRRRIVVHVEEPVIQVLVIVATNVKARVRRVEVPVIARMPTARTGNPVLNCLQFLLRGGRPPHTPPYGSSIRREPMPAPVLDAELQFTQKSP